MKSICSLAVMRVLMLVFVVVAPHFAQCRELTPLKTVPSVDLARYVGLWHEIARFPNRFQKDCSGATALYTVVGPDELEILNTCKKGKKGEIKKVTGVAHVQEGTHNTQLKVNFVPGWLRWTGIGNGDYWVIDLDENYTYGVVSEPERKYLWILSRTPQMKSSLYEQILSKLKSLEFDTKLLILAHPDAVTAGD